MEHNDYKKMIQFYLYEELDLQNKKIFEEHLNSCNECKQELESYKKLFTEIKNDSDAPLNPKLLMEARLELRGLLKSERNRVSTSTKIYEKIASLITRPIGMALSGVSILFVGLFLGYIVFKSPAIVNENPYNPFNDQIKISNINFIDSDPANGQVELTFESIKPGYYKGKINDPEIQKILTYAILNEQNPGTRLNSINVINASKSNLLDDEIKSTLISVAKFDDNPGVRREALKSLKEIPLDTEIKNALIYVLLNDTSAGIRIEAINSLVDAAKKGFGFSNNDLSILKEKIKADKNNYVRFQVNNIIKEY